MLLIHIKFYLKIIALILFSTLVYFSPMLVRFFITGQIPNDLIIASIIAPFIIAGSILALIAIERRSKNKEMDNC